MGNIRLLQKTKGGPSRWRRRSGCCLTGCPNLYGKATILPYQYFDKEQKLINYTKIWLFNSANSGKWFLDISGTYSPDTSKWPSSNMLAEEAKYFGRENIGILFMWGLHFPEWEVATKTQSNKQEFCVKEELSHNPNFLWRQTKWEIEWLFLFQQIPDLCEQLFLRG